jgi:hypothetical protein
MRNVPPALRDRAGDNWRVLLAILLGAWGFLKRMFEKRQHPITQTDAASIDPRLPIIGGTAWAFASPTLAASRDVLSQCHGSAHGGRRDNVRKRHAHAKKFRKCGQETTAVITDSKSPAA